LSNKYSKKDVARAGKRLVEEKEHSESLDILSYWRASHAIALNKAFESIEEITKNIDKSAVLAKRLKRTASIVNKLDRFGNNGSGMLLNRMQDIGGCRVILSNIKKLHKLVSIIKKETNFKIRDDYIYSPKYDGYRSIHFIGKFINEYGEDRTIELQVRTKIQHSWSTAVEIVDLFTNQSIKTNYGEADWKEFFLHTGTQFAILEKNTMIQTANNINIYNAYKYDYKRETNINLDKSIYFLHKHCQKLGILKKFELFNESIKIASVSINNISEAGYILLVIDNIEKDIFNINTTFYNYAEFNVATERYLEEEKKSISQSHYITALISTTSIGDIKEAYPNYFADSSQFVKYIDIISYFYSKYFSVIQTITHWAKYR